MRKFHIRTLRLKLSVKTETDDEKNTAWNRIRQIMNDGWKAANYIASGQYFNDQLIRTIYNRRNIDSKDKEAVDRIEKEFKAFFGTKRQATTEKDIKSRFPDLPPCVTNALNQVVFSSYNKEKSDLIMGKRSLRTYKAGMPVTVAKNMVVFSANTDHHMVTWKLGRKEHLIFKIFYGKDRANFRHTIQRILDGKLEFSAPQFQLRDKQLYLLLPVKEPERTLTLSENLSVGVDLGVSIPAYIALNTGPQRQAVGSREDFLKVRTQMQYRRRRLQRALAAVRSGNGRQRKLKALNRLRKKERNFARSYNHFISKKVIDFTLKNQAGSIKIEMLEGFKADEKNDFILRNWSYFELQELIKSKAKREGIKVLKVDPYHTSQTCSECGHYESGQRLNQAEFECLSCGNKMNADHNAALNIARSKKFVQKKTDCEFYKKRLGTQPKGEANVPVGTH